jgi:hypothetical protein
MQVVTYFSDVAALRDPDLLELWKASWARYGWEPIVLTFEDALRANTGLVERLRQSPLLKSCPGNPPDYVWACLVGWVAHLNLEGPCLHLDWDIMCNGYRPEDAPQETQDFRPVFLSGGLCPCAIFGWPKTWQMICAWLECAPFVPNFSSDELLKDNADQYAIAYVMPKDWAVIDPKKQCLFYQEDKDWRAAPMIHFPTRLTGYPRSATIRQEGIA